MFDLEENLIKLCDLRKSLVEKLRNAGFDAQQIYEILRTPYTDDAKVHISDTRQHYARTEYCLRRFEDVKCRPDGDSVQFWFYSNNLGVKSLPAYKLLGYDCIHSGEPLYDSFKALACSVILPALDLAIKLENFETVKKLTSVIESAMPKRSAE